MCGSNKVTKSCLDLYARTLAGGKFVSPICRALVNIFFKVFFVTVRILVKIGKNRLFLTLDLCQKSSESGAENELEVHVAHLTLHFQALCPPKDLLRIVKEYSIKRLATYSIVPSPLPILPSVFTLRILLLGNHKSKKY